jgi:hypothetical protein
MKGEDSRKEDFLRSKKPLSLLDKSQETMSMMGPQMKRAGVERKGGFERWICRRERREDGEDGGKFLGRGFFLGPEEPRAQVT